MKLLTWLFGRKPQGAPEMTAPGTKNATTAPTELEQYLWVNLARCRSCGAETVLEPERLARARQRPGRCRCGGRREVVTTHYRVDEPESIG